MLSAKSVMAALLMGGMMIVGAVRADTSSGTSSFDKGAVFVMTNDATNNEIARFGRAKNGTLFFFGKVATGGRGSFTQPIDPLASQNSILLTKNKKFLLASNAGSNEISVFAVDGHALELVDKVPSNGLHPVSITIDEDIVYVLNTGGDGSVAGFKLSAKGKLEAINGAVRSLGLNGTVPPQTNNVNHQILFNPDGDRLIVSGGINTNQLKVYRVDDDGLISADSVDSPSSGANPFSLLFSRYGELVVSEADGTNALSSYRLNEKNDALSPVTRTLLNGRSFSCWVVSNGNPYIYVVNTVTDDLSLYRIDPRGALTLVNASVFSFGLRARPTDAAFSDDGKYLYTLVGGAGTVGVLRADRVTGNLSLIEEARGLEDRARTGLQGIAAY